MTKTPRRAWADGEEKELGRAKEADGQGRSAQGTGAGLPRSGGPGGEAAEPWLAVLRELPREAAGPAFTQRVLARVAAAEARPTRARPFLLASLATATAAALVAVVALRTAPAPSGESTAPPEPRAALEAAGDPTPPGAPPAADRPAPGRGPAGIRSLPSSSTTDAPPATAGPDRATSRPAGTRSLPSSSTTGAPPAAAGPDRAPNRPAGTRSLPGSSSATGAHPVQASASLAQVRAELAELRRRHDLLARELIELPGAVDGGRPVLYLGGDEGIELVLDLGRARVEPFAPPPASASGRHRAPSPVF